MAVKVVILLVFFVMTVAIGIFFRKTAKNVGDFVLGGRNVGSWMTAFAYGTSYFSAVIFVGYAGQFGWIYGVSAVWIGLGNAFIGSLMAWVILGRRTRVMTKALDSATMPDFFEKRYSSNPLKIAASLIIFFFMIPYTASVYKGLAELFKEAFGLEFWVCAVGMAVLTGFYIIAGGYMGGALNSVMQGVVMAFGIVAVVITVLNGKGGFMQSIFQLSEFASEEAATLGQPGAYASFFGPDPKNLIGVVILTSLGTWGLPQMVHKFYTIKSSKAVRQGTIISTIFAVLVAGGSYFNGAFGRLYIALEEGQTIRQFGFDNIIPTMLGGSAALGVAGISDALMGVVILVVLSASMSTLSALVMTSASTLTLDFIKGKFIKTMKPSKEVFVIRILCAVCVLISVLIALFPNMLITNLMSISWGAMAGAFLAPFLYGLFWKKATRAGVWASFITAVGITVFELVILLSGMKVGFPFNNPINSGAFAMVASLIVFPLVSLVSKKLNKDDVDEIFKCYDGGDMVSPKYVAQEE